MNRYRKTALLALLGLILAWYAGDWLFQSLLEGPRQQRERRTKQLQSMIQKRKQELKKAEATNKRLDLWESQSLPSNPEIAVSLYRAWLTEAIQYAKFSNANVSAGSPMDRKGMYRSVNFSIRAVATLEQLTTFLFEFYKAGHLHQIGSINLTPLSRQDELDVSMSIEALILPTATRKDQLNKEPADRLAFDSLADYAVIAERNVFASTGQGVHQTDQTFLTAVVAANGRPQAWFTVRSTDQVLRLSQGDTLAIGQFQGTIQEIQGRDVIVALDGERWLMTVGESLAQALALPPEY